MNLDRETVAGFGKEWSQFDQSALSEAELQEHFEKYFAVFPWQGVSAKAEGFDLGCGSGRWARLVAERVGVLHCIDASEAALEVARRNLGEVDNCKFHHASVDQIPLADGSMDFGYSLGVLHHIPDTQAGLRECARKLKPGAPFLVYLYYAFDNRPRWFMFLWKLTDLLRRAISRLPHGAKLPLTTGIAVAVYWPLARLARLLSKLGVNVESFPLSIYRARSFYSMRTDAYDRFSTRLEKRFTAAQVREMMKDAGLQDIVISDGPPHWCAAGIRGYDPVAR
ncbi:MAG: class I SAM-dependent methyltransferase [Actinobacteria bacterium]|nr:class I SAM-dependent methyltransferase [Actinomycetota bacterium]